MNEIHAGLHARYLEERWEMDRCEVCKSEDIFMRRTELFDSWQDEGLFCPECEDERQKDVETFEEWAERNEINLDEL